MAFKHIVYIIPHGDECGACEFPQGTTAFTVCGVFGKRLRHDSRYHYLRCADCKKAEARAAKKEPTDG